MYSHKTAAHKLHTTATTTMPTIPMADSIQQRFDSTIHHPRHRDCLPPDTVGSRKSTSRSIPKELEEPTDDEMSSSWKQDEILLPAEDGAMVNVVPYFGTTEVVRGNSSSSSCDESIAFHLEQRPEWENGSNQQCQGILGRYICRAGAKAGCPLICRLVCPPKSDDADHDDGDASAAPQLIFTCAYSGTTTKQKKLCCPFRFTVTWSHDDDDECGGGWIVDRRDGSCTTHTGLARPLSLEDALRVPNHGKFILVTRSSSKNGSTSRVPSNNVLPRTTIKTKCSSEATPSCSNTNECSMDDNNSDGPQRQPKKLEKLNIKASNSSTNVAEPMDTEATSKDGCNTSGSVDKSNSNNDSSPQRQHKSETCNGGTRSVKVPPESAAGKEPPDECGVSVKDVGGDTKQQSAESKMSTIERWQTEEIMLPTQNGLVNIIPHIGSNSPRGDFVKLKQNAQWDNGNDVASRQSFIHHIQEVCGNAGSCVIGRDLVNGNIQFVCTHSKHNQEQLQLDQSTTTSGTCRFRFSVTWLSEDRCWAIKTGMGYPIHRGHAHPDTDDGLPRASFPSRKRKSSSVDMPTVTEPTHKHPRLEAGISNAAHQLHQPLPSNIECENVMETDESTNAPQNGESTLGNKPAVERWTMEELLLPTKDGLVNVIPFIGCRKHRGSLLKLEERTEWRDGNKPACRKSLIRCVREACAKGGVRVFATGFVNNSLGFKCQHAKSYQLNEGTNGICNFRFSINWFPKEACWAVKAGFGCPDHIGHERSDLCSLPPIVSKHRMLSFIDTSALAVAVPRQEHPDTPCQDPAISICSAQHDDDVSISDNGCTDVVESGGSTLENKTNTQRWQMDELVLPMKDGLVNIIPFIGRQVHCGTILQLEHRPEWGDGNDSFSRSSFIRYIQEVCAKAGVRVSAQGYVQSSLAFVCQHGRSKRIGGTVEGKCCFRFSVRWLPSEACWAIKAGIGCPDHVGHARIDGCAPCPAKLPVRRVSYVDNEPINSWRQDGVFLQTDNGSIDAMEYVGSDNEHTLINLQKRPEWRLTPDDAGRKAFILYIRQTFHAAGSPVVVSTFTSNRLSFMCTHTKKAINDLQLCKDDKKRDILSKLPRCMFRFAIKWQPAMACWALVGGWGSNRHCCHTNSDSVRDLCGSTGQKQSCSSLDTSQRPSGEMEQPQEELPDDSPTGDLPSMPMKLFLPTDHGPVDVLKYTGSEFRAMLVKLQIQPEWHSSDCDEGRHNMIRDVLQSCSSAGYPVVPDQFASNQQDFVCQHSAHEAETQSGCSFRFAVARLQEEKRWAFVGGYGCGVHTCHTTGDSDMRIQSASDVELDATQDLGSSVDSEDSSHVNDLRRGEKHLRMQVALRKGEVDSDNEPETPVRLEELDSFELEDFGQGAAVGQSEILSQRPLEEGLNHDNKSSERKGTAASLDESKDGCKRTCGHSASSNEDSDEVEVVGVVRPITQSFALVPTSRAPISTPRHSDHLPAQVVHRRQSGANGTSHIANQRKRGNRFTIDPVNVQVDSSGTPSGFGSHRNFHSSKSTERESVYENLHPLYVEVSKVAKNYPRGEQIVKNVLSWCLGKMARGQSQQESHLSDNTNVELDNDGASMELAV